MVGKAMILLMAGADFGRAEGGRKEGNVSPPGYSCCCNGYSITGGKRAIQGQKKAAVTFKGPRRLKCWEVSSGFEPL